jgi:hypothetical protein
VSRFKVLKSKKKLVRQVAFGKERTKWIFSDSTKKGQRETTQVILFSRPHFHP